MEAEVNSVAQVLRDAAELIGEHGWAQGMMVEADGSMCAIGAIYVASGMLSHRSFGPAWVGTHHATSLYLSLDAREALAAEIPPDGATVEHIAHWNDRADRTAEDVILALKRASHRQEHSA